MTLNTPIFANFEGMQRKKYKRSGKEEDRKLYCTLRKQTVQTSFNKKKTFVANKLKEGNSCKSLYSVVNRLIDNKKEAVLPKCTSDKELANRFQAYFKENKET